jgi:hypothetical protein
MQERIFAAVVTGIAAVIASFQVNGLPKTKDGWLGVLIVFIIAALGKGSTSTALFKLNREEWTPERRTVEAPPGK